MLAVFIPFPVYTDGKKMNRPYKFSEVFPVAVSVEARFLFFWRYRCCFGSLSTPSLVYTKGYKVNRSSQVSLSWFPLLRVLWPNFYAPQCLFSKFKRKLSLCVSKPAT